jgi:predicted nucleotide-binding protein (sugar kinase/HSP70/actin superfamily)
MGISSRIAAACLRHFNIDAMVLPTHTRQGYELARKHIHTEVCHPLKGVTGDVLAFLHAEKDKLGQEAVERKYVFIHPTTDGPCRFGKYRDTIRFFLDDEGFAKVPIAGPTTKTDYTDILDGEHADRDQNKLQKLLLRGIIAADMLDDITLRFRPYHDKDEIGRLKEERLAKLETCMERGDSVEKLVEWGKETVRQFGRFGTKHRFPLVLYSGEIYMRMHDPDTGHVIERLEENRLEVVRCPMIEWLEYINCFNLLETKRDMMLAMRNFDLRGLWRGVKMWGMLAVKNAYIEHVKHKLSRPFEKVLHGRHQLPPMSTLLKTIQDAGQFHTSISGESILGVGICHFLLNELMPRGKGGISGIFHVGPFTCMHEGVVTAKMEGMVRQKRKENPGLIFPVIDAYFGDSPNPNLDAEIAIFREQCYQNAG